MRPLLAALLFLLPAAASAAELRADVVVAGAVVTVGDLFTDAGQAADLPLFRAPELGVVGRLPAATAVAAAAAFGVNASAGAVATVTVTRTALEVTPEDIEALLRDALADRLHHAPAALEIAFAAAPPQAYAAVGATTPISLDSLSLAPNGRFQAVLSVDQGAVRQSIVLSGSATAVVEVVTLVRDVARGEAISPADLAIDTVDGRRLPDAALTGVADALGYEARRALRAGQVLTEADLQPATVVDRNTVVTLTYVQPGMTLQARGLALDDGAVGELVSVLNQQSRRIVEGIVVGPGTVEVGTPTPRLVSLAETAR